MSTYNKVTPEVIAALQKVVGAENVKTDSRNFG
jgi:hypothetical protein